jgi:hypothetical protein
LIYENNQRSKISFQGLFKYGLLTDEAGDAGADISVTEPPDEDDLNSCESSLLQLTGSSLWQLASSSLWQLACLLGSLRMEVFMATTVLIFISVFCNNGHFINLLIFFCSLVIFIVCNK